MARADWPIVGESNKIERSNVMITITDNAGVVEGGEVVAVCNGKTFTSTLKNGVAKLYTTEVGTYTITVGEYSTMLVCPYYGQFSTDIYSGTLKVTCTEAGGNNKTCHVQSCDYNYEFTNSYNLTQTFDTSLVLTFLGIPTGKYLITVDDKYRFFKEITSIQNINEIDVELKQWLFNNGDQCEWNTGGWMQCQCNNSTRFGYATGLSTSGISKPIASQSFNLTSTALHIYQNCMANEVFGRNSSGGIINCARGTVSSNIYCGTKKELPLSLINYTKLINVATQSILISLRSGETNNENTNASTEIILASGTNSELSVNLINTKGYVVLGRSFRDNGYGCYRNGDQNILIETVKSPRGNLNYNYVSDISEIYLI